MDKITNSELDLLLDALNLEWRTLNNIMNDLARRGLHQGNQQVEIQRRMIEVSNLKLKVQRMKSV